MTKRDSITIEDRAHKGGRAQSEARSETDNWQNSLGDGLLLASVIIVGALALAAFAVAAPVILAVSALVGLIARNGSRKGWRSARAQ